MKAIATWIAAALALLVQGAFADAHATKASGHCTGMTVVDYVSSDALDSTRSDNFVNVTDGHLNFTTSNIGCVMITFSGLAVPSDGTHLDDLHVRTLLDGSSLCMPATADDFFGVSGPAGGSESNAFAASITRICKNVAAGTHSVQVQYRSGTGDTVLINSHVLTITHN